MSSSEGSQSRRPFREVGPAVESVGRIAWASLRLEEYASGVCETILEVRRSKTRQRVSDMIKQAIARIQSGERIDAAQGQPIVDWLTEVAVRMRTRNQVLHSFPVTIVSRTDESSRRVLLHYPDGRDKDKRRLPLVETLIDDLEGLATAAEWTVDAAPQIEVLLNRLVAEFSDVGGSDLRSK